MACPNKQASHDRKFNFLPHCRKRDGYTEWFGPDCWDVDGHMGTKGDIPANAREFGAILVD
jgi:hypothetical protein